MKNSLIRVLISLFLCCCLVLNVVSLPARASAVGAIEIVKASAVTGNPYIIAGATLIALGVYAGVETGAFETLANNCVDALEAAGTWIKDGAMELLRTEDADGNASYYVDSGLMEDVRSWAYDSGTVASVMGTSFSVPEAGYPLKWSDVPFTCVTWTCSEADTWFHAIFAREPCNVYGGYQYGQKYTTTTLTDSLSSSFNGYYWNGGYGSGSLLNVYSSYIPLGDFTKAQLELYAYGNGSWSGATRYIAAHCALSFTSSFDISLGTFPSQTSDLTDGTSARQWSEDYTDRGLKVYGGGSGNNNNDGKWFWKLMLPLTAADLLLMSQADEWSGETPNEFDDYTTVEELEILSRPEVEFGQGLELAPVTSSSPDPGTGTNPDTGTDTDPDTGTNTGTNFLDSLSEFFTPSGDITMYSLDLKDLFPFCIPFDIYDFLAALSADPVPPVFEFDLNLGVATEPMKIDLSNWSDLAAIIRTLELGLFCVGLALKTRELIGG